MPARTLNIYQVLTISVIRILMIKSSISDLESQEISVAQSNVHEIEKLTKN